MLYTIQNNHAKFSTLLAKVGSTRSDETEVSKYRRNVTGGSSSWYRRTNPPIINKESRIMTIDVRITKKEKWIDLKIL